MRISYTALACLVLCADGGISVRIPVPAGPIIGRNCTEHAGKVSDDAEWLPKCRGDGTYDAVQVNIKTGLKFCVSKEGLLLVAPQRSLAVFPGALNCDCPRKRFEKFQSGNFEGYIHRCDTDFTYSVQQFDPATNITYCLMKEGQIIQEYSGTHMKACKCPRQWYEAKNNPLSNRYIPTCTIDGHFTPIQCHDGKCWCGNSEGEQISSQVYQGNQESLKC